MIPKDPINICMTKYGWCFGCYVWVDLKDLLHRAWKNYQRNPASIWFLVGLNLKIRTDDKLKTMKLHSFKTSYLLEAIVICKDAMILRQDMIWNANLAWFSLRMSAFLKHSKCYCLVGWSVHSSFRVAKQSWTKEKRSAPDLAILARVQCTHNADRWLWCHL